MNKSLFSGWNHVFSFTFKQGVSGKGFKAVTIGLGLALFLIGGAISVIMAVMQQKDATEVSPIQKVYVVDESGLDVLYLDGFMESFGEEYPELSFVTGMSSVEEANEAWKLYTLDNDIHEPKDVILHVGKAEKGYLMTLYLPEQSEVEEDEAEDFLEDVTIVMEQSKLFSSGIATEKLVLAMSGISTTFLDAGEQEKSLGEELVAMLLPLILVFFMYMMFLLYGQSIGNIVSVEKTSKLMEMILTLTRPYGLIFGKVFAMTVIAILQIVLWMVCFVVGFIVGDVIAGQLYSEYNNVVLEALRLLGGQEGSTAFTAGAVVLAIFVICLAFLFYSMIAGLVASFATKAEELAQMMAYYQLIMIAGFFGAYMGPLQEKEWLNTLLRIIPVTSAYILPGDIMVGNITVWQGMLYAGILLVTTLVLVVVTGKVYKNQLFYRGSSLKDRFKRKK